jgi:hypothetical protein
MRRNGRLPLRIRPLVEAVAGQRSSHPLPYPVSSYWIKLSKSNAQRSVARLKIASGMRWRGF